MWDFCNIKPVQTKEIPWGWENIKGDNGELWVVKHPMKINMPSLVDYFDWDNYTVACPPRGKFLSLGTTNMKSTFTTAARFLSYEKLLIDQPDLSPIADVFCEWNRYLLRVIKSIDYFIIGDDIGSNKGLIMSPSLWRTWIAPQLEKLIDIGHQYDCEVIYHSDGDISAVLDDLQGMGVIAIEGERIGQMTDHLNNGAYQGMTIMENIDPRREKEHKGWQ